MPKKLMDCVKEVKKEKPEDQAFAICISSTNQKPHKEKKVKKSLEDRIKSLCKATIHHKDTNTFTDVSDMSFAKLTIPQNYQRYIEDELRDLEVGVSKTIPLKDGKELKIYKVEEGVYSGNINAKDGTIFHNIDRVTIPEIVNHLVTKDSEPEVEEENLVSKDRQLVININISKSGENIMDSLDSKINALCKGEEKIDGEVLKDTEVEEEINELEQDPGRKKLVSDIISLLSSHNKKGHSENVSNISKFLVHLHRDENNKEEVDEEESKKSISESIFDLRKGNIKFTKEESREYFDLELEEMIKNVYLYCRRMNIPEDQLISKISKKVNKNVIRRMGYDETFLLAKRAVKYDEDYLADKVSSVNFEKLDEKFEKMVEREASEPMYYSKEAYTVFGEREGISTTVLDALEKGNNFFKGEIRSPKLAVEFFEKDYEKANGERIEKHTDKLIKSGIDSNFKR